MTESIIKFIDKKYEDAILFHLKSLKLQGHKIKGSLFNWITETPGVTNDITSKRIIQFDGDEKEISMQVYVKLYEVIAIQVYIDNTTVHFLTKKL